MYTLADQRGMFKYSITSAGRKYIVQEHFLYEQCVSFISGATDILKRLKCAFCLNLILRRPKRFEMTKNDRSFMVDKPVMDLDCYIILSLFISFHRNKTIFVEL